MALFADPSCFDGVAPIFSRGPFRIYLAGQAYSLADVAATPYIFRAEMLGLDKLWVGKRPGVEGWCARIRERLSFGRAIDSWFTDVDRGRYAAITEESYSKIARILGDELR
jgi:glutathione S-transferase